MTEVSKESESIIREMNYVTQITQSISEDKPLDVLLNEIMESCKLLMNAEASSLLIYDEKEDHLYFSIATGEKGEGVKNIICKMGEGIAGWVAANRTHLMIEDCYDDPRFNREFDIQSNFRTKSMLCVPMIHREKLIGVIQVINKKHGENFTERDLNIFQILSSQCAISIENARLINVRIQQEALNRELKTAREIQQNLLPSKFPEFNDIDVSMIIIPAKQIGGDYYNVYTVIPDQTLFFICDVSGKSISAALIVSTIFSSIITYFKLNNKFNLIEFVKCLNNVLIDSTTDEKFATCWFGLYDHNARKLQSVNAGHNTIYVFKKKGDTVELNDGGLMLGCTEYDFKAEEITMDREDILFLYTDGVPEAMSKSGEFYGDDRAPELIRKFSDKSADIILKNILRDIENFTAGADQSDDITCGIVKIL